nr:hypothetical protein [uncultured Arsenicibacter sp.]
MNLQNRTLEEWLISIVDLTKFPHKADIPTHYKSISSKLRQWVHDNVNAGAADIDHMHLTNHGVVHIETLIKRISQMLNGNDFCELTPFESYILLLAAHIHDVGNIFGRKGHEINAVEIIKLIGNGLVGEDQVVWSYVYDIAKAHKGEIISTLPEEDFIDEEKVRIQLLAAILKFADELAENTVRADLVALALGTLKKEAELFHYYAKCLNSVVPNINARSILLKFHINEDLLSKTFLKIEKRGKKNINKQVYLMDEIYLRTLKTYSERVYCSKYLRPYINFDTIKVSITIQMNDSRKITNGYELCESGITKIHMDEVFRICPSLKELTGKKIHSQLATRSI